VCILGSGWWVLWALLEYPFRVWGFPYVITVSPLCNGPGPVYSSLLIHHPTPVRVRVCIIQHGIRAKLIFSSHLPLGRRQPRPLLPPSAAGPSPSSGHRPSASRAARWSPSSHARAVGSASTAPLCRRPTPPRPYAAGAPAPSLCVSGPAILLLPRPRLSLLGLGRRRPAPLVHRALELTSGLRRAPPRACCRPCRTCSLDAAVPAPRRHPSSSCLHSAPAPHAVVRSALISDLAQCSAEASRQNLAPSIPVVDLTSPRPSPCRERSPLRPPLP
jgi:hypothetical protein